MAKILPDRPPVRAVATVTELFPGPVLTLVPEAELDAGAAYDEAVIRFPFTMPLDRDGAA